MEIKINIPTDVHTKLLEVFETDDIIFNSIKDYISSVYKSKMYKIKEQQIEDFAKTLTNEDEIEAAKISVTKIEDV